MALEVTGEVGGEVPVDAHTASDREWLETVYRRNQAQLTMRAVISGMIIGAVMCLSNLYVVLKTGWSLGVTVTAAILGFAVFRILVWTRLVKKPLGLLENGAIASVAASAGYMTGGGNMAAIPALFLLTGVRPEGSKMFFWFACIATMGIFCAIPIKRQLINQEKLPFPTGTATAETLISIHGEGAKGDQARWLGIASIVGAVITWMRDAKTRFMPFNIPDSFPFPGLSWAGYPAAKWTVAMPGSLILVGAGALMSFKTGWSLLIGAAVSYGWLGPYGIATGAIKTVAYKSIVQYTLWPAAAMMLSSSLLAFAFQWRSIAKSFSALGALLKRGTRVVRTPYRTAAGEMTTEDISDVECPEWWFPAAYLAIGPIVVAMMSFFFGIPWWAGVIAVPLSVVMGVVAARVTGETDTTPTKALGPVTQFMYGALLPGHLPANLMGANVTGGVGLNAADILTDLKTGYLIGANPRKQLYAQLFGVIAGAIVIVPAFNVLIRTADDIGSAAYPAPAVQVWAGVSRVLVDGIGGLALSARIAALVGAGVGVVMVLLERWLPKRFHPYIPSASGVGIAMVIPGSNAIAMFVGSLIAEITRRKNPALAERLVTPISSGFIAGESLMGILVAVLVAFGVLDR